MPWCPKCENEYVKGVERCADCGCPLVDSLDELHRERLIEGGQELMQAVFDFLTVNGLKTVKLEEGEERTALTLLPGEKKRAERYAAVFFRQRAAEEAERAEEEMPQDEGNGADGEGNEADPASMQASVRQPEPVYEAAAQKAENYRSGAGVLLASGAVGLILVLLLGTGILPVRFVGISRLLALLILGGLSLLFLALGSRSLSAARSCEGKAKEETELKEELMRWCRLNLKGDAVDASIPELPGTEEERYFKRTERIRQMLAERFVNLDPGYLENFVDEIYPEYFE